MDFIGLTLEEGIEKANKMNYSYRIVREDGDYYFLTQDIREDRINFDLDNNIIVEVGVY